MDPADNRGESLNLFAACRVELSLASRQELHAHRRCVEPATRAAEVVQRRSGDAPDLPQNGSLALGLSAVGRLAAGGDPDDHVASDACDINVGDPVDSVAVAFLEPGHGGD